MLSSVYFAISHYVTVFINHHNIYRLFVLMPNTTMKDFAAYFTARFKAQPTNTNDCNEDYVRFCGAQAVYTSRWPFDTVDLDVENLEPRKVVIKHNDYYTADEDTPKTLKMGLRSLLFVYCNFACQ